MKIGPHEKAIALLAHRHNEEGVTDLPLVKAALDHADLRRVVRILRLARDHLRKLARAIDSGLSVVATRMGRRCELAQKRGAALRAERTRQRAPE
jgi:hypothetical protein